MLLGQQYLSLGHNLEEAKKLLPVRAMTVAAWVRLDDTAERCGLVSFVGGPRSNAQGWVLGFHKEHFVFGLSAGSAGGDARLTYLSGKTTIELGRWYYVAATYDGAAMRLYVNGELDGESNEQSGDIAYPREAQYLIGGSINGPTRNLMEGALFEVKSYARCRPRRFRGSLRRMRT